MEEKPLVTVPVADATKTEEMLPQSQVNGLIAKEVKAATEKLLKDIGVEDFKSAKDGIAKAKEIADAQKTEAQKLAETNAELVAKLTIAETKARQTEIELETKTILKELSIDEKYAKTILKLADLSEMKEIDIELIKSVITKTINEELPMLVSSEKIKVGGEKKEDAKPSSTRMDYLADKYKNNPYFKK